MHVSLRSTLHAPVFAAALAACSAETTGLAPGNVAGERPASAQALPAGTVVVTPLALNGWSFVQETPSGSGELVGGRAPTSAGSGSARLTVDAAGGYALAASILGGTHLDQITTLGYSTWQSPSNANPNLAIALQFNVDFDLDDESTAFQGRLVFEPYYTYGTPAQGTWQQWDALAGKWWATRAPFNATCSQAAPCTKAQVLAAWPNAGVHLTLGAVLLKAGGGWGAFTGHADALTIGVNGSEVITYDFEGQLGACAVSTDAGTNTLTLQHDCTTDHTLRVPDGWTLDGDDHTLTGVDPADGAFVGAVLRNGGTKADVRDVTVTVANLKDACHAGDDRLRGILFEGAAGSIKNTKVAAINQGASGCQEGNGIEVRNEPFDASGTDVEVDIVGNRVTGYQKAGIVANGSVAANITNNVVTGAGPVNYIAQNGIQVAYGGTALVRGNTVSGNNYTPKTYVSCGLLLYQAQGVRVSANTIADNERDVCNFGKGGGTFNPQP
jgi:Right handed beta helix region